MQDVRYAVRTHLATPIVTTVAVLSLALGIGANTVLFSLINTLVLRSLPVVDPQRLAVVSGGIPTYPWVPQLPGYTYRIWTEMRDGAAIFDAICAWSPSRFSRTVNGPPACP